MRATKHFFGLTFFAQADRTSFVVPKSPDATDYHQYKVLKSFDVPSSKIAPWFDEPGGGNQYFWNQKTQDLIDRGYIQEITK